MAAHEIPQHAAEGHATLVPDGSGSAVAVLTDSGWRLGERRLEPGQPATELGAWTLQPVSQPGVRLAGDVRIALIVSTLLPDETTRIEVLVASEHSASDHQDVWEMRFRLLEASPAARVHVGVAQAGEKPGRQSLRPDREVRLRLFPPIGTSYWANFAWQSPDGTWNEHTEEIPLRDVRTKVRQGGGTGQPPRGRLREFLLRHFNLSELKSLCAELGIELEDIPGETRNDKARELVEYAKRHGRTQELEEAARGARPNVPWGVEENQP